MRKTGKRGWGIPKGGIADGFDWPENAAKEAFEEAGVAGYVCRQSLGNYVACKRTKGLIRVHVYLLRVTATTAEDFPERGRRELLWCAPLRRQNSWRSRCCAVPARRYPQR